MIALLKIEWLKIRKYNTFWILSALFIVLLFTWNYLIGSGVLKLGGKDMNLLNTNYTFPSVWENVGHWTKFFSGLLAIIIIILTTNEYQFRTNRQNVIDGWQRAQFFHAKWLIVLLLSIIVTVFTTLLGIGFAVAHGSPIGNMTEHMDRMLYVFILTMNYFGFALTLSFLIRKSGMTIIIFLLYAYIIEIMAQQLINWKLPSHPGDFLPMQCSAELLNFPMMDMVKTMMAKTGPSHNTLMLVSVGWIVVYYIIGRIRLLKSDW